MFLLCALGIILVSSTSCFGSQLPSFIKTCYQNDPDLNKCLQEHSNEVLPTFSKGVPELGVEPLDPLFFDRIDSSLETLNVELTNTTLKGLGKAHISKFKLDKSKSTVSFRMSYFPHMTGKYKISGNILLLNIQGEGDYVFDLGRTNCTVSYKHRFYTKNDTRYATMVDVSLKCNIGKGTVHFHNLFGGNKILGDTVNNFLNANFDTVMNEEAKPVMDAINKKVSETMNVFYASVPFEVIIPKEPPTPA